MLLAPARFEPCGLTQMYGMRYGALPVVRRVGGLADTVTDSAANNGDAPDSSTGFVFNDATVTDFAQAVKSAADVYRDATAWRRMQARAMARDFSWRRSADRYLALYRELAEGAGATPLRTTADPVHLRRAAT